jgi:acyl-CoA thioesterase-1
MKKPPPLIFNLIFITLPAILLALLMAEVALRVSGNIYFATRSHSTKEVSQKSSIRFLCLGDSYTWGLGAISEKSYPMQLKELLEENCHSPVAVYNAGIPGFNSSLIAKKLNGDINKYNPDFIIVMVGSNNV